MNESALHALAARCGLQIHWHDYLGRPQVVSAAVLSKVLEALGLAADSDAAIAASMAELDDEQYGGAPAMLVVNVGETLRLPAVFNGVKRLRLELEDGRSRYLTPLAADDGGLLLPAVAEPGYHQLSAAGQRLQLAVAPPRAYGITDACGDDARIWGLAAQVYSLRRDGDGGVGDFSALAHMARAAAGRGADLLTVSPLHALFAADIYRYGPYAPSSRLFLNAMHVDPAASFGDAALRHMLAELGLAAEWQQLEALPLIDWPQLQRARLAVLRGLWRGFAGQLPAQTLLHQDYSRFVEQGGAALQSHACFEALHGARLAVDASQWHWRNWPRELQNPSSAAVAQFAIDHADEVGFHLFLQWLADRGCAEAQAAAKAAGMRIGLISDLAVGTDSGGSQAWSHQADMLVGLSVGAPPDLLNTLGQNWGLTTFSPRALRRNAYAPFIGMLRAALRHAGGVRIDHILGLGRLWLIPEGGNEGCYLRYPLADFFKLIALESWRHRAIVIGEDLGTVPDDFRGPLGAAGILGMRVMWFERDYGLFVEPARWSPAALATTTTHDLPTVAGWWRGHDIHWRSRLGQRGPEHSEAGELSEREIDRQKLWDAFRYAGVADGERPADAQPEPVVDAAIRFVARSACPLAIVPLEDIAGLDEQPNFPGTIDTHPNWQRRLPASADALLNQAAADARLQALAAERPHSAS